MLVMRYFLYLIVLLFSINQNYAQDIKIGIKAGLNFSQIIGGGERNRTTFDAFQAGLMGHIGIDDKFAIQPELIYSRQGYGIEDRAIFLKNSPVGGYIRLDYINLPVLLKYYLVSQLFIEAGPQLGYFLCGKTKVNHRRRILEEEVNREVLNSMDCSIALGTGYFLDNGWMFNFRCNLGISDVSVDKEETNKKNGVTSGGRIHHRNNVFQLSVGYLF